MGGGGVRVVVVVGEGAGVVWHEVLRQCGLTKTMFHYHLCCCCCCARLCIDRVQKMHAKGHEELKIQIPNLVALDSITKYKKAIQYDNTLAEAYYRLGKGVAPTSATEAHVLYSKALEHNVHFVDAMFAKANLYYNLRNKALGEQDTDNLHKGVVLYLRAIALEPKALDLRINLALAYRYVGQIELALEMARSILAMDSFHRKASALIDDINAEE